MFSAIVRPFTASALMVSNVLSRSSSATFGRYGRFPKRGLDLIFS
jgi:hypothetical protein